MEKQALSFFYSRLKQVKAEVCQSEPEVTGTREITCKWLKVENIWRQAFFSFQGGAFAAT